MAHVDTSGIDDLLEVVWDRKATDLLLTAGSPPLIRVDGTMSAIDGRAALTPDDTERVVAGVIGDALAELRKERELDFAFGWRELARFRANAFFERGAMTLSVRKIPLEIPTLGEIRLPAVVEEFLSMPQGLVLVTGPTGAGKSTTLASMLDWINAHRATHIVTIEDPIEYIHRHKKSAVNQREVGEDTHSFARALRSVLREDPDVVLVGEMRDQESIQTTLTIAETGHLVFATLHTNDTATALDRIVDVFPTDRQQQVRVQLAAVLVAVVAQRLVPKIGGGLVAAFELLVANTAVRNLIREGKSAQLRNVLMTNQRIGMQTLEMDLSRLVADGVVTYDAAVAKSVVPKDVRAAATAP
ncbi:MAG TPA: PilT/PilU family type 4a pilus ATPase [Acidimicrobiales bacterium]|nr:PilT/PilU family type 4a pilus ATPase [Acidimicrobiales bacterium]